MTEHAMPGSRTQHHGRTSVWRVRPGVGALQRTLGVATAVLLAVDAYVHFHDAGFYGAVTTSTLSEANLFRAQAAVAVVVGIALLIRPHPVVWAVAVLVTASAVGAVLLYTYVDVGALGPLPDGPAHGRRGTSRTDCRCRTGVFPPTARQSWHIRVGGVP